MLALYSEKYSAMPLLKFIFLEAHFLLFILPVFFSTPHYSHKIYLIWKQHQWVPQTTLAHIHIINLHSDYYYCFWSKIDKLYLKFFFLNIYFCWLNNSACMYGKNVVHKKKYYAINFSLTPFLYFSEDGNIKWHKEGRKKKFDTRVSSWQNILFRLHFAREKIKKGGNMFFISWKLFFFSFWAEEEKVFNFSYLKINLE